MNERPFDLILFDLGATLIYFDGDWNEIIAQSHRRLVEELIRQGYTLPADAFTAYFLARMNAYHLERDTEFIEQAAEYILRDLLASYGYPQAAAGNLQPALRHMYAVTEEHWLLEQDTLPTLNGLRAAGYQLGLISNANDVQDIEALLDIHGLRSYFDQILISAAVGLRKPHPRIFQLALAHFQVPASRAVMVGDMLGADILGAHNAGMAGIWLTRRADRAANRAHEDTIQPDAEISTLLALPALLQNWPRKEK